MVERRVVKLFAIRRGHIASSDGGVPLAMKKMKRQFPSELFHFFFYFLNFFFSFLTLPCARLVVRGVSARLSFEHICSS